MKGKGWLRNENNILSVSSIQLLSRVWLCNPMDCSTPGFPVHHQLLEFAQTHVHWVGLFLGAPKSLQLVTAVMKLKDTCSLEEKLMTKPRLHIKKKKHHFADKGPYSPKNYKAMVFPVVMYGCKSWTVKKDKSWRIDGFELWCWRRLTRVPWTPRRSNQSILKEISPEYSLEGLMLKMMKGRLIGEDPDAGTLMQEKGTTED